jgi:hypothetical protein
VAEHLLNPDARRENIRALSLAAGISEEEAATRLEQEVLVTFDSEDGAAALLAAELIPILSRTLSISISGVSSGQSFAVELVIGQAGERTPGPHVFALLLAGHCIISRQRIGGHGPLPHRLNATIAACYVAGAVIARAVGDGLSGMPPEELTVPFNAFIGADIDLLAPVYIDEAYLAGAGAIGNGFVWAARHVDLRGCLNVVDDDVVSAGNLQRQVWFDAEDINKAKAGRLCLKAQPFMPQCLLMPAVCRLQEHPARADGPWLRRLIVAVDSRRARRHLENELPCEVFDASTTGSQEIVLHYNRQPTELACLGCIYPYDEAELTHEQAVAGHLGVDVEAVRRERISATIAHRICAAHPQLDPLAIEGLAFDTLYKQLCSTGKLRSISGKEVVAPFAFVSVLAGASLLLEIVRRQPGVRAGTSNDWRVNPWHPPVPEMRQRRRRRDNCECCGRPEMRRMNAMFWSVSSGNADR